MGWPRGALPQDFGWIPSLDLPDGTTPPTSAAATSTLPCAWRGLSIAEDPRYQGDHDPPDAPDWFDVAVSVKGGGSRWYVTGPGEVNAAVWDLEGEGAFRVSLDRSTQLRGAGIGASCRAVVSVYPSPQPIPRPFWKFEKAGGGVGPFTFTVPVQGCSAFWLVASQAGTSTIGGVTGPVLVAGVPVDFGPMGPGTVVTVTLALAGVIRVSMLTQYG